MMMMINNNKADNLIFQVNCTKINKIGLDKH